MADNQHRRIAGYRELSEAEIALMNKCKAMGQHVGELCTEVANTPGIDGRWAAIARTELQQGFMALVRSIAQPTTF